MDFDVHELRRLYAPDQGRIRTAMARQAAVWRGEQPDQWPLLLSAPLSQEQQRIPSPDLRQAFYDADLMLCSQVRGACAAANSGSDAVPSARGNYGTATILACLGLEQQVFADKMPWLRQHLSKEQLSRLEPQDLKVQGTFGRGLEYMRRHRRVMGGLLPLYCMDTQGPFDLAHLALGDELFYQLHDDPPFVHHLMELCVELGIRAHEWMKEVTGEPSGHLHHGNALYAENMGIRICEDTTAIVSPATIEEFAAPYTRRLAAHFGGAWVHYCGRNDVLSEIICGMPEVRGINFGHIPGREHDHPFAQDMQRCADHRKVYFGSWPRFAGESGGEYLRRLHGWASQGCLITQADAALGGEGGFGGATEALDFWYSL